MDFTGVFGGFCIWDMWATVNISLVQGQLTVDIRVPLVV